MQGAVITLSKRTYRQGQVEIPARKNLVRGGTIHSPPIYSHGRDGPSPAQPKPITTHKGRKKFLAGFLALFIALLLLGNPLLVVYASEDIAGSTQTVEESEAPPSGESVPSEPLEGSDTGTGAEGEADISPPPTPDSVDESLVEESDEEGTVPEEDTQDPPENEETPSDVPPDIPEEDASITDNTGESLDTEAPVITLKGNNPARIPLGSAYSDLGALVSDNRHANLGYTIIYEGEEVLEPSIPTNTIGIYTLTYSAVDGSGNRAYQDRTIEVYDPLLDEGESTGEEDDVAEVSPEDTLTEDGTEGEGSSTTEDTTGEQAQEDTDTSDALPEQNDETDSVPDSIPREEPTNPNETLPGADQSTTTATTTGEYEEAINIAVTPESRYMFADGECTLMDGGGYYCVDRETLSQMNAYEETHVVSEIDTDGDKEIFLIKAGEKIRITNNATDDDAPVMDTSGRYIAWHTLDMTTDRFQIMMYDSVDRVTRQVTNTRYNNTNPSLYGSHLVWQGWVHSNWDVLYNADPFNEAHEALRITDNDVHDMFPQVYNNLITWQASMGESWIVFVYDTLTGTIDRVEKQGDGRYENPRFVLLFDDHSEAGTVGVVGYDVESGGIVPIRPVSIPERIPENPADTTENALPAGGMALSGGVREENTEE